MDTQETKLLQERKNYAKILLVFIISIGIYIIAARNNNIFIKFMPIENYLTWHTILEFASILISFSIFTVTYFIYEESGSTKIIMFSCVFLLMGLLDIFHTLSFKGMPYFFIANDTANRATTLFILSRFLGSLGFMAAISISPNKVSSIKKEFFGLSVGIFCIVLFLLVTYYPSLFPPMYIEGVGLAKLKVILEYLVILITMISLEISFSQYKITGSDIEYNFMVALLLLMFSEFAFTNYGNISDAYNYIGHIYKVIAFVILYKSIYVENVSTPFREMSHAKNKLKAYSDNLNIIVEERTEKLEHLNKILLKDIEYAKEMQKCLLPAQMPKDMCVSFDAIYLAAENLSGDFYNVLKLDKNNIAIYIGDVSGHGISAAMLTVFAYQNITHLKEKHEEDESIIDPSMVLENLYSSFNKTNINEEKYIVMLYGIYNTNKKTFTYSSAGINVSPYIVKKSGEIYEMNSQGFPICKLGDLINPTYETRIVQLEIGDKILFYSDGLVDAKNKNGEIYGQERLKEFLDKKRNLSSIELNTAIKYDFYRHIGYGIKLTDDVTFLNMIIIK